MERYYVKRPTGKVFGPFDANAIRLMLKGNKLGADAQVSTDNENWMPISQVDAFSDVLGERTHAGFGSRDLPQSASAAGLPRPKSASPSLPRPLSDAPDLPRSAQDIPELPAPRSHLDAPLPTSAGSGDLPRSAFGDLPTPGGQLPRPAGSNLPTPGGQLPRPAGSDLPTLGGQFPKPASIPAPALTADDDDLFGSPIELDDDLFGSPAGADDDLFAAPVGFDEDSDDLFAAPVGFDEDSDDLFASPARPEDQDDDLFASPARPEDQDDDLFAAPVGFDDDSDDLFAANPMDDDDLFAAPTADKDDFLGGDQGFVFLDDGPGTAQEDSALEDWEQNLTRNDAATAAVQTDPWGDDLVAEHPPQSTHGPGAPSPQPMPVSSGGGSPFRPASSGIPQTQEAADSQSQQEGAEADKKRGLMTLVGVPVLALALIGGVGYGVYTNFFATEAEVAAPIRQAPKQIELSLDQIQSDNFMPLLQTIERAGDGQLDITNKGRLLLAQNAFLLRYDDEKIAAAAEALTQELLSQSDDPTVAAALALGEARKADIDATRRFAEPLFDEPQLDYFAYLAVGVATTNAYLQHDPSQEEIPAENQEDELLDQEAPESEEEAPNAPAPSPGDQLLATAQASLREAAQAAPTAAPPHYWLAQIARHQEDTPAALEHLERAINAAADHVASRLIAGQIYYEQGDLNDAAEYLGQIIEGLADAASGPERSLAFHLMGMVHMARQESEEAIDMFTRALSTDSSRVDTLRALAEEYERAKMYEEALNFFTTNQNLGQEDPEVMLGIVRSHMGLEEYATAIRKLEEGEEQFPEDARFPYFLGLLNLQRGTFYEARQAFERSVEIDPDLLNAHAALAQLSWRIDNDPTQAENHVRAISERPDKITAPVAAAVAEYYRLAGHGELARQWNQAALKIDPNYWDARLALSRLLLDENRNQEALVLLERARDEGVRDIRLSAYLADAYRQDRQFDRAINEINKVIAEEPDNVEYIFIRGRIYFDQGNFPTAREDFNNAYQLDTRFHDAYFYVGRTALEENDYSTALRIFRHVLDYQPDNGRYHYYMGRTFEADGSLNQALDSYRRASAVDPQWARSNPGLFIRRGRLLTQLGYTRQGKQDLQQALQLNPDLSEALIAMGETNFRERDYTEAIENYSRGLSEMPENPRAQYELGMSYVYENKHQDGARHLQQAIHYGYDNADIYRTLGYVYRQLNQRQQALESFKAFLRESPPDKITNADQREILQQIKNLGG